MSDVESRLRSALHDETGPIAARPTLADDMVRRGITVRRRRRVAGGVACLAVLAAAVPVWQSVDTGAQRIEPARPTLTAPTTTPTRTADSSLPPFSRSPVTVVHHPSAPPRVLALRSGRHAGFDRIVVDLHGGPPSYIVAFRRSLVGASGQPSALTGKALLLIRLSPAAAHTAAGKSSFDGLQPHPLPLPTVRGYALIEDNEGTVSLGLALDRLATFRVFELSSPTRLVIDVRH